MIINKYTKIKGKNVTLVPYKKEHVLKYHEWMKSPELQDLTCSEPLSLEEEYEMQHSWLLDANKCTFIVLDNERFEETANEIDSMIGDTNLFFLSGDDHLVAEAEIMIAEPWGRGRKCGWEAMLLMMSYGAKCLDVKQYTAKIKSNNDICIGMFEKMGFQETSQSIVFNEVTMDKVVDDTWKKWLELSLGNYEIIKLNEVKIE